MNEAVNLCLLVAACAFFFLLRPYFVLHLARRKAPALDTFFVAFTASALQLILTMYLLLFVRLLHFASLLALLLLEDVLAARVSYGAAFHARIRGTLAYVRHVRGGYIAPRRMWQNAHSRGTASVRRALTWGKRRWLPLLLLAGGLGFGVAMRAAPVFAKAAYGVTDLYVYTEWIKAALGNNVFVNGVYFYGMHNLVAGLSVLFGFDVVTLLRLMGLLNGGLLLLAAYWLSATLFRGRLLPALCALASCLLRLFPEGWSFRQPYLLAQEFSQLFMLISAGFFVRYLRAPSRGLLALFAASMAGVLLSHYYGALVLALFCVTFAAVHIDVLLKNRGARLRELAVVVVVAVVVGLAPLGIGLLQGKPLEASFGWGFSVMATAADTPAVVQSRPTVAQQIQWMHAESLLWAVAAAAVTAGLSFLRRVHRPQARRMCGMVLYHALLLVLMLSKSLGLPPLMDEMRCGMFLGVTAPLLFFLPLEGALALPPRSLRVGTAALICGVLGFYFARMPLYEQTSLNRAQHDGAVYAYYDIAREHPKGQWTIVSPVEEMSFCMGRGYHYELYDFIALQENFDWDRVLEIPTRYVFFYVEKQPLNYERIENLGAPLPWPITSEEAMQPVYKNTGTGRGDTAYVRYAYRRVLESKMFFWAESFAQAFPDDTSIYYEDDMLRVYKYTQNMYNLTNFALPYAYNEAPTMPTAQTAR